jgi:outer membrane protein OmpA-like peptidoglycan-associated protein
VQRLDLELPRLPKLPDVKPTDAPDFILGEPCTPYTSRAQAEAAWTFAVGSFIPFAKNVLGGDVAAMWSLYLARGNPGAPRPHQNLNSKAALVTGFASHHRTTEVEQGLLDEVIKRVNSGAIAVTPGVKKTMSLADALGGPGVASTLLGKGGSLQMRFDSVATTVAGNLAGGVGDGGLAGGAGGIDPDTRNAGGDVDILVTPGTAGAPGTVTVTSHFNFHVHDTVDFCPGDPGGALARVETIPMSRLEQTGAVFGPRYAADVPFDVDFPGTGRTRSAPFTAPPSPKPIDPPIPPVVLPTRVLFDFDSSTVKPEGKEVLRKLLPKVQASPSTEIVGHTDSVGTEAYNQKLSERRAEAVKKALIELDPSVGPRLKTSGRGEREPIDTNETAAGRAKNRRVELIFGN